MELNVENVIEKENNLSIEKEKGEFEKIISNVIDKTSNYIIKMLPVQQNVRDVILDVKEAIKTKDMKTIVKTAINSSLREAVEFIGIDPKKVQNIIKVKDALFKGGVREALCAGIDIAYSKHIKNNILGEDLQKFVDKLKENINGKEFTKNINEKVQEIDNLRQGVDMLCKKWYDAYGDLDLDSMNKLNKDIEIASSNVTITEDQKKNISIIDNMTRFVNNKQEKLNENEVNLCRNI